jgi:hypothetical protein
MTKREWSAGPRLNQESRVQVHLTHQQHVLRDDEKKWSAGAKTAGRSREEVECRDSSTRSKRTDDEKEVECRRCSGSADVRRTTKEVECRAQPGGVEEVEVQKVNDPREGSGVSAGS